MLLDETVLLSKKDAALKIFVSWPVTRAEVASTRFLFIYTIHSIVPIREMISRNSVYHYHGLPIFSSSDIFKRNEGALVRKTTVN